MRPIVTRRIATTIFAAALIALGSTSTAFATFPGENGVIAFSTPSIEPLTGDLGPSQIWAVNPDGTDRQQLTDLAAGAGLPAWSADGEQIAFQSGFDIWIMNADGSELHRVTPNDGSTYAQPSFSPDGQELVLLHYPSKGGPPVIPGIYAIGVDGLGLHLVKPEGAWPKWSPDGSRIAFEGEVEGATQIMVMDPDGNNTAQLTNTFRYHGRPDWTPDGRIAYIGNEAGDHASDAYVINSDGSEQHRLHDNPIGGDTAAVAWSPDGTQLVFSTYLGPSGGAPFTYRLHTLLADGSGEFELTADPNEDDYPAWQPLPIADNTAPVLNLPGTVTANATQPSGAIVTFTIIAEDNLDPNPEVSCVPSSGSVFAIGTSTVDCTATDSAGNHSEGSFEVLVRGSIAQIEDLIDEVGKAGLGKVLAKDLLSKLEAALANAQAGKPGAACKKLNAFIVKVEAEDGKKLTTTQAAAFLEAAARIESVLSC